MKKQLFYVLIGGLLTVPFSSAKADTVQEGQSTEGKDFWVTFLQADQDPNNTLEFSLSISSRENCQVTIENPYTSYSETFEVTANEMKLVEMYSGNVLRDDARAAMTSTGKVCYAVNSEQVDTCALHVTATANISLFATNYKKATFDATNVLPTASLLDDYVIQTYTPSDHGGTGSTQGSHFGIIAAEDDVVVDITPTVPTKNGKQAGETFATETLKKGQVYYVWTGKKDDAIGDLSGTTVKARDGKKIAVFQGCPHTNIPYQVKQRDHIFSQAMPTQYWGNTFVLTASASRPVDKIRILALNDETEVKINGELVYTFDFSNNPKHYWEFEIGSEGTYAKDGSCLVNTSCPCAVHLFIVSQQYHGTKSSSGDPAMLWINPIEQQIDQVTFATYASKNGTTAHYVNVVTDNPALMTLDNNSIESQFQAVNGSSNYYYAQVSLGSEATSHTLKSDGSNFIAHVYGFTSNESYGYSAGGATKPLTSSITINGEVFTPDTKNTLCGVDTIRFACHPDYEYEKIEWYFGDGKSDLSNKDSVTHYYPVSDTYEAYVLIYRESSNLCAGYNAVDSIPITVTIGRYEFTLGDIELPCPAVGQPYLGFIPYTNSGGVNLKGDNVTIEFDAAAKRAGFEDTKLVVTDSYFQITVPENDKVSTDSVYGLHLTVTSDCGGTDTTMLFRLSYDKDVIVQRGDNVLGLSKSAFDGKELSDFQWYRASDSTAIAGETNPILNFYDLPNTEFENDAYYVCFNIKEGNEIASTCTCAKQFGEASKGKDIVDYNLDINTVTIVATYIIQSNSVFVNADYNGKTGIECYAQWIDVSGRVVDDKRYDIPDGGCLIDAPKTNGLYLLRVVTDKETRSFKFIVNH